VLDEAVLTRVIRNDRNDAFRRQSVAKERKGSFQDTEFIVDRDAHGLEQRRELRRPAAGTKDRPDCIDEIVTGLHRPCRAPPDDLTREASRARFVGVFTEDADQLVFVALVEHAGSIKFGVGAHPHVEPRALTERESPALLIDLVRRHTEIEEHGIPGFTDELRPLLELREIGLYDTKRAAALVLGEVDACSRNGGGILIDSGDTSALREECECMPASSKRTVQDVPSVAEQLGDLAGENRRVKGWKNG
jgi:hypothetical protein